MAALILKLLLKLLFFVRFVPCLPKILGDCLDQRVLHLRFCDIVLSEDSAEPASRVSSLGHLLQQHINQH
jgi:hypothetical protein